MWPHSKSLITHYFPLLGPMPTDAAPRLATIVEREYVNDSVRDLVACPAAPLPTLRAACGVRSAVAGGCEPRQLRPPRQAELRGGPRGSAVHLVSTSHLCAP